jgi:hypothetical protein
MGNEIIDMSKKHKVTFIDQVMASPVAEIIEVESYKKYNCWQLEELGGGKLDVEKSQGTSCCSMF